MPSKSYYESNKAAVNANVRMRQNKIKRHIQEYKLEHGCSRCGYKKSARALQFHHRDPKDKTKGIARMVYSSTNIDKIQQEIDKCDLICANCHFELHELETGLDFQPYDAS